MAAPATRGWVNVPNALTLLRILLTPILLVILLTRLSSFEYLVLALFWVASFTDWLDGFLARKRHQATTLGAMLDPLADKILTSSVFIAFVELNLAPAWMVTIIVARELLVTGLRGIAAGQALVIHARVLGKAKLVFQVVCISALILAHRYPGWWYALGVATLWGVVIIAVLSMLDYVITFVRWSRTEVGARAEPQAPDQETHE